MEMILLANGCSHTAGMEIEYADQYTCYEKAWPAFVAKKLKLQPVNLATPGQSNDAIVRKTTDWLLENVILTQRFQPSQIKIITMWSGFDRSETVWQREDNHRVTDSFGLVYSRKQFLKSYDIHPMYKDSFADLLIAKQKTQDSVYRGYRSLRTIYLFNIFLESLKIKHYNINGLNSFHSPNLLIKEEQHELRRYILNIYQGMGEKRITEYYSCFESNECKNFFNYYKNHNEYKIAPWSSSHFCEDVHEDFANRIHNFFFSKTPSAETIAYKKQNLAEFNSITDIKKTIDPYNKHRNLI